MPLGKIGGARNGTKNARIRIVGPIQKDAAQFWESTKTVDSGPKGGPNA